VPLRVRACPAGGVTAVVSHEDGWPVVWDCHDHDLGNLLAEHPGACLRAPKPLAVPAAVANPYGEDYPDVLSYEIEVPPCTQW